MNNIYLTKYASAVENALKLKPVDNDNSFVDIENLRPDGYIELPIDDSILKQHNLFRNYMEVVDVDTAEGTITKNNSNTLPKVVSETGQAFAEDEELSETKYYSYKLALITKVKQTTVFDKKINMTDYLRKKLSKKYGKAEEKLILNGTGINEPLGLLNYDLDGVNTSSVTYDSVIDLFFSLDKDYRDEAIFIINDETALLLRKLKDADGNYLWNNSNDTILGKKVIISNYMTTPTKPVIFGNFAYLTFLQRERISVKVLNQLYADNGDIGYASKERLDFKLTDINSVKVLMLGSEE